MALTQVQGGMLQGSTNTTTTIQSNGTTAITIDSSQNVGVGSASSGNKFEVAGSGMFSGAVTTNTTGTHISYQSGNSQIGAWGPDTSTNGTLVFFSARSNGVNGLERMRINSSGNVGIGTTSNIARLGVVFDGNTDNGEVLRTSTNASGAGFLYFQQDTNTCGSVVRVGTTSAVTYSTTSDYRLKENVMPMTNGLDKVSRLKPVTYTWKQGGESAEGFIAHELAEVCPDAVVGTKDQMETYIDEDGNEQTRPKYQSIDTSFLVATLTAAIQELKAELDATKAEVAALKAAP